MEKKFNTYFCIIIICNNNMCYRNMEQSKKNNITKTAK